jgi:hypothetical protein
MNIQDEVTRSLIRGLGWRVTRSLPWWLAAAILLGVYVLGHR